MRRFLLCLGVCVLLFVVNTEASKTKNQKKFWELFDSDTSNNLPEKSDKNKDKDGDKDFMIDDEGSGVDISVDTHEDTHEDDEDFEVSSGAGEQELDHIKVTQSPDTTDDEDLYEESGSGMIVEEDIVPINSNKESAIPDVTEKPRPLTPCENLRNSALDVADFIPECNPLGAFRNMQCMMDIKTNTHQCWCVTANGAQIQGTLMEDPETPDCDFGTNMKTCVFQLVQNGQNLLGAVKPRCTQEGEWEPIQCHGSECWCVDWEGNQILGSPTNLPAMPNCDPTTTQAPATKKPVKTLPKSGGGYTVAPSDTHVVVTDIVLDTNNNANGNLNREGYAPVTHDAGSMFSQPGFLAAIIAGGVITLLLVVLLVMFIVYRMRKKDEGSYPLDEQKFQNYSYAKAPDKEFYA